MNHTNASGKTCHFLHHFMTHSNFCGKSYGGPWDVPSRLTFRNKEIIPQLLAELVAEVPADRPQLSAPVGTGSAKGSHLTQGCVAFP